MLYRTIWRLTEVMARTSLSRSTIYDLIRKGQFPSQVNLGPRAVGWVANEIEDWIEARIDESRARDDVTTSITRKSRNSRHKNGCVANTRKGSTTSPNDI